jgi:hypothetical protein
MKGKDTELTRRDSIRTAGAAAMGVPMTTFGGHASAQSTSVQPGVGAARTFPIGFYCRTSVCWRWLLTAHPIVFPAVHHSGLTWVITSRSAWLAATAEVLRFLP